MVLPSGDIATAMIIPSPPLPTGGRRIAQQPAGRKVPDADRLVGGARHQEPVCIVRRHAPQGTCVEPGLDGKDGFAGLGTRVEGKHHEQGKGEPKGSEA